MQENKILPKNMISHVEPLPKNMKDSKVMEEYNKFKNLYGNDYVCSFHLSQGGTSKSAAQIQSELQIPHTPTYYGEFDTLQIIDDVKIPKEDWGRGTKPEPITNYFGPNHPNPAENFGKGGATQAVTKTPIKEYELKEIDD
jgi:hypothetical protein